jgi:hypothetical protein
VTGHGTEGLGKLLFIQRQAFPNFYRRGPVVKSNYQKFQVLSGYISVTVLGVFANHWANPLWEIILGVSFIKGSVKNSVKI